VENSDDSKFSFIDLSDIWKKGFHTELKKPEMICKIKRVEDEKVSKLVKTDIDICAEMLCCI